MIEPDRDADGVQAAAADLVASLAHGSQSASVHLARLLLAGREDERSAYRLFVRTLTRQLRGWTGRLQAIQEDDVSRLLERTACELAREDWDD